MSLIPMMAMTQDEDVYDRQSGRRYTGNRNSGNDGNRTRAEYDGGNYMEMNMNYPMGVYDNYYPDEIQMRRYRRYQNGRFAPRNEYDADMRGERWPEMRYDGGSRNEYRERPQMHYGRAHEEGRMNRVGFAMGSEDEELDRETAEHWTRQMKNEDGTTGPHWNLEQTKKVMEQHKIDCDPYEFYAAINMMYSDYCKVAKEFNVDSAAYYAKLAKAFLEDKDAGKGKLKRYYECVVEG